MIRVGIIGTQYGCDVLLPAFRADRRCQVVGLAARSYERAVAVGTKFGIPGYYHPRTMIESAEIDVVAIAVPPAFQPDLIEAAAAAGKAIFAEKPLGSDVASVSHLAEACRNVPVALDFNVAEFAAFRKAKLLLEQGAIGKLRSVSVNWCMENRAVAGNLSCWKTDVLSNFAPHTFHYLEWLFGGIEGLSCALVGTPAKPQDKSQAAMLVSFETGLLGSVFISSAAFGGSGHRVEIFGEDGVLRITNERSPYNRRFELFQRLRGDDADKRILLDDTYEAAFQDPRCGASAGIVRRLLDAVRGVRSTIQLGLAEGLRVQDLIDAARDADEQRSFIPVSADGAGLALPSATPRSAVA